MSDPLNFPLLILIKPTVIEQQEAPGYGGMMMGGYGVTAEGDMEAVEQK